VADYCPEFAEVQALAGFDGETPRLRPPARQATVRNLITHTSGLGYWFWSEDLVRWEKATGIPNVVAGSRFLMNDDQRPNSTPVHVKGEDGTWASIGEVLNQAPDYWAGLPQPDR
jgi:methyl acetate hydrolase